MVVVIVVIVCFYLHPKEQQIIQNKKEQRLQKGLKFINLLQIAKGVGIKVYILKARVFKFK